MKLRYSAFTLIELLVAATVFVVVAVLATSAISGSIQVGSQTKHAHLLTTQTQNVMSELEQEIAHAPAIGSQSYPVIDEFSLTDTQNTNWVSASNDDLLIVTTEQTDGKGGYLPSSLVKYVYCPELQISNITNPGQTVFGKRLVRYTLATLTSTPQAGRVAGTNWCTASSVAALFNDTIAATDYLTDPTFEVLGFRVWPSWASGQTPAVGQVYDKDPAAVRVQLSIRYNPANASSGVEEVRSNQANQSPLTLQRVFSRSNPFKSTSP